MFFYLVEAPGVGYSFNGTVKPSGSAVVPLPTSVLCDTYNDQNKGVYLQSNSSDIIVIGQNMNHRNGDTFLALPYKNWCNTEYVYYGITTASSYRNIILIVGTEDNTVMNLTVTQKVTVKVDLNHTTLASGSQNTFVINRLQTVYIATLSDLTGTRIATDKPVSVTSGNECAVEPSGYGNCEQLLEQIPATMYWGKIHYTMPFSISTYYSLKMVAAYNSTMITVYCDNVRKYHSRINEGQFALLEQQNRYCAIYSDKKILVAQISLAGSYYRRHYSSYRYRQTLTYTNDDPMLTIVPATAHYSNEIKLSTSQSSSYTNYINIVVLAEYYQPSMIFLEGDRLNKQLDSLSWTPITYNGFVMAYGTRVSIPKGTTSIVHRNATATAAAQMTAIVYGSNGAPSYGHPAGFNILKYFPGKVSNIIVQYCMFMASNTF